MDEGEIRLDRCPGCGGLVARGAKCQRCAGAPAGRPRRAVLADPAIPGPRTRPIVWAVAAVVAVVVAVIIAGIGWLNWFSGDYSSEPAVASEVRWYTLRDYEQVQVGMTMSAVAGLLGGDNAIEMSHAATGANWSVIYAWLNPDGSNITIEFANTHVVAKTSVGLH
jgi:hypothetical protein